MYHPAPVKAMVLKSLLPMVQVELQEGLEQIDYYAYEYCSSLEHHIRIPSTITEIEPWTFRGCCSLSVVAFSNEEIEEFGNRDLLREIWNNGTSEHSLAIYNFLHWYKIPARLGIHAQKWVSDIGARMRVVASVDDLDWHSCVVYEYFESIYSKLKVY